MIIGTFPLDSHPTRWSFSFILGPLHWSFSWQWQPCIAVCGLFRTLLWTELADFAQFLQNVSFIYVMKPQICLMWFWRGFTPNKQPWKLTLGVFQNFLSYSVNSKSLKASYFLDLLFCERVGSSNGPSRFAEFLSKDSVYFLKIQRSEKSMSCKLLPLI